MVDMRSPTQGPLSAIREQIEPQFAKALEAENSRYGLKAGDPQAVSMKLVWFGDRPAYQRSNYNDIAMQAVAVGFIIGVIQDSVETALNSSGDAMFTIAADLHSKGMKPKDIAELL